MITNESKRWIAAGKLLADNPNAQLRCPRCEFSTLEVENVINPDNPEELERILRCAKCGAKNALRLRRSTVN